MALAAGSVTTGCYQKKPISVGSKDSTEQELLGEIVCQHLERRLGRPVQRKLKQGETLLVHNAIVNGEIDVYPEYTGTALRRTLKLTMAHDRRLVFERVRDVFRTDFRLEWFEPLGFENPHVMVTREEVAAKLEVKALSDAEKYREGWRIGFEPEFGTTPDGMPTLSSAYRLPYKAPPVSIESGLLYRALDQGQVDMIAGRSTDGMLSTGKFRVIEDDRRAFPPCDAALVVRSAALTAHPEVRQPLQVLSGKFDRALMRRLNYRIEGDHRRLEQVAAEGLREAGLG